MKTVVVMMGLALILGCSEETASSGDGSGTGGSSGADGVGGDGSSSCSLDIGDDCSDQSSCCAQGKCDAKGSDILCRLPVGSPCNTNEECVAFNECNGLSCCVSDAGPCSAVGQDAECCQGACIEGLLGPECRVE